MLLSTIFEVHTEKDILTAVLKYGLNEMKSIPKTKVCIFSVWKEQLGK